MTKHRGGLGSGAVGQVWPGLCEVASGSTFPRYCASRCPGLMVLPVTSPKAPAGHGGMSPHPLPVLSHTWCLLKSAGQQVPIESIKAITGQRPTLPGIDAEYFRKSGPKEGFGYLRSPFRSPTSNIKLERCSRRKNEAKTKF